MSVDSFATRFRELTGNDPLSWQTRIYHEHFAKGDLSQLSVIDLPTGLGKTMVMAIWLIARAQFAQNIPTRLIYIVDRRTVVDQATDVAEDFAYLLSSDPSELLSHVAERKPELIERKKVYAESFSRLREQLGGDLIVSTLRGQLADNRQWSRDPSKPAIVIGTVDLIGSALLFSGYRSSFKRRPLEAGLLGQDSLLLLDEAHLSKPFVKLVTSIFSFQANQGLPLKVIRMSATSGETERDIRFTLQFDRQGSLTGDDAQDKTIADRWNAKKTLTITTIGEKDKLNDKLALAAIRVAMDESTIGKRIVVFVRRPDDARAIAEAIRNHGATKSKPGRYFESVRILTGTMRGLERDELIKKPVFRDRWLNGELEPSDETNQFPVFLISTSAGEVGFDLNADHMVCDAAPIDSMIQRLGRVNRRGKGDATIQLFVVPPKKEKDGRAKKLEGLEHSVANTNELLTGVTDVSPKNIAALKSSNEWKEKFATASSPEPTMVELTDILLDAWSMTSIVAPMPGRPDVAPWIRGIADELPQTTIAWRAELNLPGFDQLDTEDIQEWFDTHRVLTHETLSDRTDRVATTLLDRWNRLQQSIAPNEIDVIRNATVVIDRAGIRTMSVAAFMDLIRDRNGKPVTDAIRNADLILPASFGGIERGNGLLDAAAPEVPSELGKVPASPDVADERGRCRQLITKSEDGDPVIVPVGTGTKPPSAAKLVLNLESDYDKRVQLISFVPKQEKLEFGSNQQTLREHVDLVRKHMDDMLKRLHHTDAIKLAAELAADFHDHGKNRERWQRLLVFPKAYVKPDEPMGKSGGEMKRDPRGYRHEFGSLREFTNAFEKSELLDSSGKPITQEVFDLAMHLIAAHHGRGRPHFPKGGFDPDAEDRSESIHTDSIRRFARLQRKFGWWRLAWLENLLRCADALASVNPDSDIDDDVIDEGEG